MYFFKKNRKKGKKLQKPLDKAEEKEYNNRALVSRPPKRRELQGSEEKSEKNLKNFAKTP